MFQFLFQRWSCFDLYLGDFCVYLLFRKCGNFSQHDWQSLINTVGCRCPLVELLIRTVHVTICWEADAILASQKKPCSWLPCRYGNLAYYAWKQLLLSVLLSRCNSVCLSVRPSVRLFTTWVDQSKTVQARIAKSSPSAAWKTLVSGTVKLFHKFEGSHPDTPNEGAKWEGGGQNLRFLANKSLYLSNGAR